MLLPLTTKIGVDPVHFGLIMVLNLMIGLLTPPVGMVLYILARVSNISFERATRACAPFLIPLLVTLAIVTYWPGMVLWLPKTALSLEAPMPYDAPKTPLHLRLSPADDVVIALRDHPAGTRLEGEDVPRASRSRLATRSPPRDIAQGEPVRRYGQIIGFASRADRARRARAHPQPRLARLRARLRASAPTCKPPAPRRAARATFEGIVRADGRVATRNYIGVITT